MASKLKNNRALANLTTITVELGFLWNFVLLLLKTCSLYHEKLFIQKVNDISSQVFNNFFSASDIMEAVRGRFCFYRYECKVAWYKLDCCELGIGQQAQAQCNRLAFRVLTQGRRIQGTYPRDVARSKNMDGWVVMWGTKIWGVSSKDGVKIWGGAPLLPTCLYPQFWLMTV